MAFNMNNTNLKSMYAHLLNEGYFEDQNPDMPTSHNQGVIVTDDTGNALGILTRDGNVLPFEGNPYGMYNDRYSFGGDTATSLNTLYDNLTGGHYAVYNMRSGY
jgi:hypothetical protein